MIERQGDIWDMATNGVWVCITTNGMIRKDGKAVMGKGIALQAKERIHDIDTILAEKLKARGNVVSCLASCDKGDDRYWVISFPTKHDWRDASDIELIKQSAQQLKGHFDSQAAKFPVLIARPGCGNGGLNWEDVKKVLEPILTDDEFIIVSPLA